jgi:hypothetical protein
MLKQMMKYNGANFQTNLMVGSHVRRAHMHYLTVKSNEHIFNRMQSSAQTTNKNQSEETKIIKNKTENEKQKCNTANY